jgi:hypothetical protein
MTKKILTALSAVALAALTVVGIQAPASGHTTSDLASVCTTKLGTSAAYWGSLTSSNGHTMFVYTGAGIDKACAFTRTNSEGSAHTLGVSIRYKNGTGTTNQDAGTYAHYAGAVEKNNITSNGGFGVIVRSWYSGNGSGDMTCTWDFTRADHAPTNCSGSF